MKSRKQKALEYNEKYRDIIGLDAYGRLNFLCDKFHIGDRKYESILYARDCMLASMYYSIYRIVLYEDPEGSPRPRARLINRSNLTNAAMSNGNFIHIYSITGHADNLYMKRLMSQEEYAQLDSIIYTACDVDYYTFHKIPSNYNATDAILAEIGLERPLCKPDWDNIGKKYSDMYNGNVWIDDTCVIRGTVDKYYSILPRVEITLRFLNALYNVHQFRSMKKRIDSELEYYNKGILQRG
jgi:Holliday junction resolvase RusA-like endonuclease